jgi:23S rRNA (adenine2503-C2)-methyltransferase
VNLIPLNPTAGFGGRAATAPHIREFADRLAAGGLTPTIRRNRGTDIDAACGQLRERANPGDQPPSIRMPR